MPTNKILFGCSASNKFDNKIIKKCDRSHDICALKYGPKDSDLEAIIILQEFSNDDSDTAITWEYLLYNRLSETYDDSKFYDFSKHIFLTKNMILNIPAL